MITLTRRDKLVKLDLDARVVGRAPHARHQALLESYLFNAHRGHAKVLGMMIRDLRGCLDIGADRRAADLVIVLRLFLSRRHEIVRASRRHSVIGADRGVSRNAVDGAAGARRDRI